MIEGVKTAAFIGGVAIGVAIVVAAVTAGTGAVARGIYEAFRVGWHLFGVLS